MYTFGPLIAKNSRSGRLLGGAPITATTLDGVTLTTTPTPLVTNHEGYLPTFTADTDQRVILARPRGGDPLPLYAHEGIQDAAEVAELAATGRLSEDALKSTIVAGVGGAVPSAVVAELAKDDTPAQAAAAAVTTELIAGEIGRTYVRAGIGTIDPDAAVAVLPAEPIPLISTPPPSNGAATHPSVVHVPGGWNGHEYWLAVTPMPGGDYTQENPCIYHSDDGETWTEPAGLTNPIEGHPGGTDYNSDTHMVLDGDTMRCFWRQQIGNTNYYMVRSSTDGVDWSTREIAMETPLSTQPYYSGCFIQHDGGWHFFAVDGATDPKRIIYRSAPTYTGPWTEAVECPITPQMPAGREPWHLDVHRYGNEWHSVLMDQTQGTSGGAGGLYFMVAGDDLTWRRGREPLAPRWGGYWDKWYRSCIVPTQRNGRFAYEAWYAWFTTTRRSLAHGFIDFIPSKPLTALDHAQKMTTARLGVRPYIVGDTFTRPDSDELGTAESGQDWQRLRQTLGIRDRAVTSVLGTNAEAVIEAGTPDAYVEFTIRALPLGSPCRILFRHDGTLTNNTWRFGYDGVLRLHKVVDGTVTQVDLPYYTAGATSPITTESPDVRLGVACRGDQIRLYVNGHRFGPVITDPTHADQTLFGFNIVSADTRITDFIVRGFVEGEH